MVLCPIGGGGEPGAPVQIGPVAATCIPDPGGIPELPVQADAFAVLVEPAPQRRPLADQDLVRDLGGALAERHQPRVGEPLEQALDDLGRDPLRHQLVDRGPPAGLRDALAQLGEPQKHAPGQLAPVGGQRSDHGVGGLGDRRRHATAGSR